MSKLMKRNKLKIVLLDAQPMDLVKNFTKQGLIDLAKRADALSFFGAKAAWRLRKIDLAKIILKAGN